MLYRAWCLVHHGYKGLMPVPVHQVPGSTLSIVNDLMLFLAQLLLLLVAMLLCIKKICVWGFHGHELM